MSNEEKWLIERRADGGLYLMGAVDRLDGNAEALRLAIALIQATPPDRSVTVQEEAFTDRDDMLSVGLALIRAAGKR